MNINLFSEIIRTIDIEAKSIEKLKTTIDKTSVLKTLKLIAEKDRVVLSACGTSAMAAKKIAHSLNCIECPALFLTPSDAIHGGLGVLQKNDLLLLISKGGNTKELLPILNAAKIKKAKIVGVSENEDSFIAKNSDVYLKIKVNEEPCRFNMLATASTLAVISVFDAICIALMQYTNYSKEQFAIIHPAGAVGERLISNRNKKIKGNNYE